MNAARIVDAVKCYGAAAALQGLNLEIAAGRVTALLGANCAGKTLLDRELPQEGAVAHLARGDPPPDSAAREISDVKNIAREALKEVRMAVSGFRAAALEGEIAVARALLGSSGVELSAPKLDGMLPAEVERDMAMIVREAVTNIHRHAGARHAVIEIRNDTDAVVLVVRDDGKGGVVTYGNGLSGIGERVRSLAEMPGLTGLELAARVRESGMPCKVVIVTTFARSGYLRRALDAGVAGEGLSATQIATQLSLSHGTVRNYLSEAIGKLHAANRVEAYRLARQKGWL